MPQTLTPPLPVVETDEEHLDGGPADPHRIRWTRADCARLIRSGILDGEQYELIEGDIVRKVKNRPHVVSLMLLLDWLRSVFDARCVQSENPIDVVAEDNRHNAPEPDAAVLARRAADYTNAPPGPSDLRLVVEVADTTLRRDTTTKARLYARAGIADYWVVDVAGRRLFVHRAPAEGRYAEVASYAEDETAAPLAAPSANVRVGDLLPPSTNAVSA